MSRRRIAARRLVAGWFVAGAVAPLLPRPAAAYPELEAWVEKHSGRFVSCALCHVHPDGPEGVKEGQIRGLSPEELDRLNRARAAFEPGSTVDSPILNDFGDEILHRLGKRRFLEIRAQDPGLLAPALGFDSDLDGDGIPDAREFLDGTDPLSPESGDPWRLFVHNLAVHGLDIVLLVAATVLGLLALSALLRWFEGQVESGPPEP